MQKHRLLRIDENKADQKKVMFPELKDSHLIYVKKKHENKQSKLLILFQNAILSMEVSSIKGIKNPL